MEVLNDCITHQVGDRVAVQLDAGEHSLEWVVNADGTLCTDETTCELVWEQVHAHGG